MLSVFGLGVCVGELVSVCAVCVCVVCMCVVHVYMCVCVCVCMVHVCVCVCVCVSVCLVSRCVFMSQLWQACSRDRVRRGHQQDVNNTFLFLRLPFSSQYTDPLTAAHGRI